MPTDPKSIAPKTKRHQRTSPPAKKKANTESTGSGLHCEENADRKFAPHQPSDSPTRREGVTKSKEDSLHCEEKVDQKFAKIQHVVSESSPIHHQTSSKVRTDQLKGTHCEGSRESQVVPPAVLSQEEIIAKINEISEKAIDDFEKVRKDHDRFKQVLMGKLMELNIDLNTQPEPSHIRKAAAWIAENAQDSAQLYQKWSEDESQAAAKVAKLKERMEKMRLDMEERRKAEVLKLEAAEQNKVRARLDEQRKLEEKKKAEVEKLEAAKLSDQKSRTFRPTETKPPTSLSVQLNRPRRMFYTDRGREEEYSRWKEQREPKQTPSTAAPPQTQKRQSAEKVKHPESSRIPASQRIEWSGQTRKRRHSRSPAKKEVRTQRRSHRSRSRKREKPVSPKRRRISKSPPRRERNPRRENDPREDRAPKQERERPSKSTGQPRRTESPPNKSRHPAFQRSPKDSPKAKKEDSLRTFPDRKKQISKAERRMMKEEEEEEFFRMPELPFDKEKGTYRASPASFPTNDDGKWD